MSRLLRGFRTPFFDVDQCRLFDHASSWYNQAMAKKGIKVKMLARELGVTARRIIEWCRAEGIPVQNSVTRLSPEIERAVRNGFTNADRQRE